MTDTSGQLTDHELELESTDNANRPFIKMRGLLGWISNAWTKLTGRTVGSSNALDVAIVDGAGAQVTSFGGGTQYTEGATDATITGTAAMWEDAADTLVATSAAKPLPVEIISSALPSGASTSAKQDTGNTSLASIDGKITAVNTGAVVVASGSITADTELTTADLDTGAGTDTRAVVGLIGSKSGGGQLIPGDATAGLKVDLGTDNDVTVTSGSITAAQATAANLNMTEASASAIKTAVELIDDTVATLGTTTYTETTTKGLTIGAVRRDADTTLVGTTNEIGPLQMDANGYLKVEIFDGGGSHTVDNNGTFAIQDTSTAATPYKLVSAATTNATSLKGAAGVIYGIQLSNVNAAARYLKLYNKASAPTVGTDTPVKTLIIPGNTAGAGSNVPIPNRGINFTTGIAFALTTEATDAGTTAVAANEIVVNIDYI